MCGDSERKRPPEEISRSDLIDRAIRNAKNGNKKKGIKHTRREAVMFVFALGSTHADDLCRRFGFDPEELVKR